MTLTQPVGARDHVRGPDDAPTTVVVYGDYECPYTRALNFELSRIQRERPELVRFVYRHFPLRRIHPHAQMAAESAEAAHAQGRFWEMHERLFHGHEPPTHERVLNEAEGLGLQVGRLEAELRAGAHAERVEEDFDSGIESGVDGTPGVFVDGDRYHGPRDRAALLAFFSRAPVMED